MSNMRNKQLIMAKSKNDNCKLRHNTFEKTSVIIKNTKTREAWWLQRNAFVVSPFFAYFCN